MDPLGSLGAGPRGWGPGAPRERGLGGGGEGAGPARNQPAAFRPCYFQFPPVTAMNGRSLLKVLLLGLVLISIDGVLCRKNTSPWRGTDSKRLQVEKNFTKREVTCPQNQHPVGNICCQLCPPGTRKVADCQEAGGQPQCTSCIPGEDYMDQPHYHNKCLRCSLCDKEHGLEIRENCTPDQDVICGCAKNFFCSTPECKICYPCTQCAHGVLKNCTESRDAICQVQENNLLYLLFLLLLIPAVLGIIWYWIKRHGDNPDSLNPEYNTEDIPLTYTDIDLSKYISQIAERMELDQVKRFVREMRISEVIIDRVKHDYANDTDEQKIQLLKHWYQRQGKKGAYRQLLQGLKNIGLREVGERLQEVISAHSENHPENGNSSLPHSQGLTSN
ncbi:LOW QUALITY PROTEIN: tumor necrosis factor receptor superfamily member 6 [Antechinus flavipes]|uniref:LOW QUALITY PROTEIN: tumor necrosis factor receptor superfamily member 6 n=1 Tax=Antechinus flavipes TaxID=38775 RepID=UPI002236390E|nr:LOW QUALITY PROTEIN: tumor necrosis factor receptor superfamily member 6 [Antechinus flavipes]